MVGISSTSRTVRTGRTHQGREVLVARRFIGHDDAVQGRVEQRHGKPLLLRTLLVNTGGWGVSAFKTTGTVGQGHGKSILLKKREREREREREGERETERESLSDDQLVRIHFIPEMIQWTGLAPWAF